ANQQVRTPLPYGWPCWERSLRISSAWNVPAGTVTRRMPTTLVVPVTPNCWKSALVRTPFHDEPSTGYAGSIGLKPYSIRSNGVKKCLRCPIFGNLTTVAAWVCANRLLRPSRRSENPYAPATRMGPLTLCTENRADRDATAATDTFSISDWG